jgi:hypothetical protein
MGKVSVLFLLTLGSCQYSPASSATSADRDASAETIRRAGMSYLVVSSSNGIAVINLTKDSMEVVVKKRNEKYLELANRQFSVKGRP